MTSIPPAHLPTLMTSIPPAHLPTLMISFTSSPPPYSNDFVYLSTDLILKPTYLFSWPHLLQVYLPFSNDFMYLKSTSLTYRPHLPPAHCPPLMTSFTLRQPPYSNAITYFKPTSLPYRPYLLPAHCQPLMTSFTFGPPSFSLQACFFRLQTSFTSSPLPSSDDLFYLRPISLL